MSTTPELELMLQRSQVQMLIRNLAAAGWPVQGVHDSEEYTPATTEAAVLDLVFNLDEATVCFAKTAKSRQRGVLLILGQYPDTICDWHCGDPEGDAFDKAVDAVCDMTDLELIDATMTVRDKRSEPEVTPS